MLLSALIFFTGIITIGVDANTLKKELAVSITLQAANVLPVVSNVVPQGYSGNIEVKFDLMDLNGDLCDLRVQVKGGILGQVWTDATVTGTDQIAPGTGLSFTWFSASDIPEANGETYRFRVKASDSTGEGEWVLSAPVQVTNMFLISRLSYFNVGDPQINNSGYVVWSGDFVLNTVYISSDIYLYNFSTTTNLTDSMYYAYSPRINDKGYVVWYARDGYDQLPQTGSDYEIYSYNGSETQQLTENDCDDIDPGINIDGSIIWVGFDGTDNEIYIREARKNAPVQTVQLTENDFDDSQAQISNGGYVVWSGSDGIDREIYLYEGSNDGVNIINKITDNSTDDTNPQINNSGFAVWEGFDGSDKEIFLYTYDNEGSHITQLSDNAYDDLEPQINNNCAVVWTGSDGSDLEIFLYKNGLRKQITNNIYDDTHARVNDLGHIVWSGWDGHDYEIFFYDGIKVNQITYNEYDDISPQLNGRDYIVWRGWNGSDWQIFLAFPSVSKAEPRIISITRTLENYIKLTWTTGSAQKFRLYWRDNVPGSNWDQVDGNALFDIITNPDGTKSWTDRGVDPDMAGKSSADVGKRMYKLVTE